MYVHEVCEDEVCDGLHGEGKESRMGWDRLGQLNRGRRVVGPLRWLEKGSGEMMAEEEVLC